MNYHGFLSPNDLSQIDFTLNDSLSFIAVFRYYHVRRFDDLHLGNLISCLTVYCPSSRKHDIFHVHCFVVVQPHDFHVMFNRTVDLRHHFDIMLGKFVHLTGLQYCRTVKPSSFAQFSNLYLRISLSIIVW